MKKKIVFLLVAIVFALGISNSQTVNAKFKKGVYYSCLIGNKKAYSDTYIRKISVKGDKLIVYGKLEYFKSPKRSELDERTKLKYKKRVFNIKKKCKMISSGGESNPNKLTPKSFWKLAMLYNGLGLSITVDKNGVVTELKISS